MNHATFFWVWKSVSFFLCGIPSRRNEICGNVENHELSADQNFCPAVQKKLFFVPCSERTDSLVFAPKKTNGWRLVTYVNPISSPRPAFHFLVVSRIERTSVPHTVPNAWPRPLSRFRPGNESGANLLALRKSLKLGTVRAHVISFLLWEPNWAWREHRARKSDSIYPIWAVRHPKEQKAKYYNVTFPLETYFNLLKTLRQMLKLRMPSRQFEPEIRSATESTPSRDFLL